MFPLGWKWYRLPKCFKDDVGMTPASTGASFKEDHQFTSWKRAMSPWRWCWCVSVYIHQKAEVSKIGNGYRKSTAYYTNIFEMQKPWAVVKLGGASRNEEMVVEMPTKWHETIISEPMNRWFRNTQTRRRVFSPVNSHASKVFPNCYISQLFEN